MAKGVRINFQCAQRSPSALTQFSILEREDLFPIVPHADHRPAVLLGLGHERVAKRVDVLPGGALSAP